MLRQQSPAPRDPDPRYAAECVTTDEENDAAEDEGLYGGGLAPELAAANTPTDVGKAMAARHRDVVALLITELTKSRDRGADARERLSHALVLLDETQMALVAASNERNALAKAKSDLEAEVARLLSENHRLFSANSALSAEVESSRALATSAFEESERNRTLLQQTLRANAMPPSSSSFGQRTPQQVTTSTVTSAGPNVTSQTQYHYEVAQHLPAPTDAQLAATADEDRHRRQAAAATRFVHAPPPPQQHTNGDAWSTTNAYVSPVPPRFTRQEMPVPPTAPYQAATEQETPPMPTPTIVRSASGSPMPSSFSGVVTSPPVFLPSRPADPGKALFRADADLSPNITLSREGHVAAVHRHGGPGIAVYLSAMSRTALHFAATVHSKELGQVVVGFCSAPLDGRAEAASLRCALRGDGVVQVDSDGSHIETRLVPLGPTTAVGIETRAWGPGGGTRTWEVQWDSQSRRVTFTLGPNVVGTPIVLPPSFQREALCPFVHLPAQGDDVVVRGR